MGIEPTTSAWEADVLPLNYACLWNFFILSQFQIDVKKESKKQRETVRFPLFFFSPATKNCLDFFVERFCMAGVYFVYMTAMQSRIDGGR